MNKYKKNILICPLDWGLGHATRCIPIVRSFKDKGCNVIIAASGRAKALLSKEFPNANFIDFTGYDIKYPSKNWMEVYMLFQIPKILYRIYKENKALNKIVEKHNIDIVISDNRFGLWNKNAYCIYITHQIITKCPWFMKYMEYPLYKLNQYFIKHYDKLWIPDNKGKHSIAGDLSKKKDVCENVVYIGPLSRFNKIKEIEVEYKYLAIISGPEPQRSIFEKKVKSALLEQGLKSIIVSGKSEGNNKIKAVKNRLFQVDFLDSKRLNELISKSEYIICRSGFSSIMDLMKLEKKAIFIPTPGQTEQEYLASYLEKKNYFPQLKQSNIDIKSISKKMEDYCPPSYIKNTLLEDEILDLLIHV